MRIIICTIHKCMHVCLIGWSKKKRVGSLEGMLGFYSLVSFVLVLYSYDEGKETGRGT